MVVGVASATPSPLPKVLFNLFIIFIMCKLIKILDADKGRRYFFFEDCARVSISFNYESSTGEWTLHNPSVSDKELACGVFRCDGEKFIFGRSVDELPSEVFLSFLVYFKREADNARNNKKLFPFSKK